MDYTHIPEISCKKTNNPINTLSSNALSVSEAHYEYEMLLIISGKANATINHKSYELKCGSLIFISSMEHHYFTISEVPYERFVISMSSRLIMSSINEPELMSIFIQRPKDFHHVIQLDDSIFKKICFLLSLMKEEYDKKENFYISKCAKLLTLMLIDLYRSYPNFFPKRNNSSVSSAVINAQKFIYDNFDSKVSLQEIAKQNFISRHTLSIAFKNTVGLTFKEYLIFVRLNEAKKLLISTDLSIAEIANQVGYINVNNFVKIFKKKESITPLKFRKQFSSPTN